MAHLLNLAYIIYIYILIEPRHDLCFDRKRPCFGSQPGVNQVLDIYIYIGH